MSDIPTKDRGSAANTACVAIRRRFEMIRAVLDERARRCWAASEALSYGPGGIAIVHEATGLSRATIRAGIAQLRGPASELPEGRMRRAGGGRKRLIQKHPALGPAIARLMEPGDDPGSPLRWTTRGVRSLSAELQAQELEIGPDAVAHILRQEGFQLQGRPETATRATPAARNAQFRHVAGVVRALLAADTPVVTITLRRAPRGRPRATDVAIDGATVEFALDGVARWWRAVGEAAWPRAEMLLVVSDRAADGQRRWSGALQRLADQLRLRIRSCVLPSGTCRWTGVERTLAYQVAEEPRGTANGARQLLVHEIRPLVAEAKRPLPEAPDDLPAGWNEVFTPAGQFISA